jgi:hypothetical protein
MPPFWLLQVQSAGEQNLRRLGALAVVLVEAVALWIFAAPHNPRAISQSGHLATATYALQNASVIDPSGPAQRGLQMRPLYPYSLVPGGVEDAEELKQAIANDPVVAAHYHDFRVDRVRLIRLPAERFDYVSYRVNDRVYWTRGKMRLAAEETLLFDGVNLARTRCGNRISELPLGPVAPIQPAAEALEKPQDVEALIGNPPEFELPIVAPPISDIHTIGHGGHLFIPPIFPVWFPAPGNNIVGTGPPPPPPTVAEPDLLLLIATGISAAAVFELCRRRRASTRAARDFRSQRY